MALLERRRAAKWHKQVIATVREVSPSEAVSEGRFALFPYAQVHAFTKEYLGKRRRSQIDTDKVLIDLINAHPRKEVAFASCADALSEAVVEGVLNSIFDVDTETLKGLEAYLQAFVAAAYSKDGLFLDSDRTFATSMIFVARDAMNQQITPTTAKALFTAWSNGVPFDRYLLLRVKLLTRTVCQHIANVLAKRESPTWWALARDHRNALGILRRVSAELEECLNSSFPTWRAWANWVPDVSRLQVWARNIPTNLLKYIPELDAPALRPGCHTNGSEWHTLIHKREVLSWFESKGFVLGPGLLVDDREEYLIGIIQKFLEATVEALRKGPAYPDLLLLLTDKIGLDDHSLHVWQQCTSTLDPKFIEMLLVPGMEEDSDSTLLRGLHSLRAEETQCVRSNLQTEIGSCVHYAAETRLARFLRRFASEDNWAIEAQHLWVLRDTISRSAWLHEVIEESLVNSSRSQASMLALTRLSDLQSRVKAATGFEKSRIATSMDAYVQNFVFNGVVMRDETTTMPQVLHTLWICSEREEVRKTGIVLASLTGFGITERTACIRQLLAMSKDLVEDVHDCLVKLPNEDPSDFVSLTAIIMGLKTTLNSGSEPWAALLRWAMKEQSFSLHQLGFTLFGYRAYTEWIANLHDIFADSLEGLSWTHNRLSELEPFQTTIETLENRCRPRFIMSNLLVEADEPSLDCYRKVLRCLQDHSNSPRLDLLSSITLATEFGSDIAKTLSIAVRSIATLSASGFSTCQTLFDLYLNDQPLAVLRLKVWLRMSWLEPATEEALRSLAIILDLDIVDEQEPSPTTLNRVGDFYTSRVAEMVQRAQRLEQSRRVLRRTDTAGHDAVMAALEIEQPTAATQSLAELPSELIDVADETADDTVELHFPLSSSTLTTMERLAFGLTGSETLLVYLRIDKNDEIDGFCVHLEDGEVQSSPPEHDFCLPEMFYSPPDRLKCSGKSTKLTYMVIRRLWRQLKIEQCSLQDVHNSIWELVRRGTSQCMVCTSDLEINLHRPTICKDTDCELEYARSHLDVRLEDVRRDNRAVDLLLSSAFAAASVEKLELLPNRPSILGDKSEILELLNSLSATAGLSINEINQTTQDKRTAALLSWLCNSYRGFLTSATDRYKIPNFPKVQQFLLVDGPPEIEAAFAQHNELTPRNLLFHGTSMDRLYSVLCQGLRVLSGTALQKHGAAYGPGIYFAREPSLAMSFSSKTALKGDTTFFDSRSDFKNVTVLLGCEHAGNDDNASLPNGIHVITDPSRVMVRYIWIVPHGTKVPRAQDLRIPMLSTFNDLRLTAAGKVGS